MDDSEWESYKLELHRLYIRQSLKLTEVIDYMATKYAFEASKGQYTTRFARWGFQKNQKVSPKDATFIERRVNKRKQTLDKESEVYVNGVEYSPRKVKKVRYGKGYLSTFEAAEASGAPSPNTPDGIVVCTPASPGMRLHWNNSLPWLRFSRLLHPRPVGDLPSPTASLAVTSPQGHNAVSYTMNPELLMRLNSVVPWARLSQPADVNSTSRTATGLSIIMPETSDGQNREMATRFSKSTQSTVDTFGLEMFLLSNNLISHGPKGKSDDSMSSHDRRVLNMFQASGWNSLAQLRALLSTNEPTAAAIAEKLFGSALRESCADIVEMLLEAGVDANCPIDTVDHGPLTPLQFMAATPWSYFDTDPVELIELFLSHDADIDKSYNGTSPLEYAVNGQDREAIDMFLSRDARITPSCLTAAATSIQDVDLFSRFLAPDTDVNARSGWQGASPLAQSLRRQRADLGIIKILLGRGADVNALFDVDFDQDWAVTTALGLAVQKKNLQVVAELARACPDFNPVVDGLPYASPLALAVACTQPSLEIIELLLRSGVDVNGTDPSGNRTLIELALIKDNFPVCEMLVKYGAMIDSPPSEVEPASSALFCAIKHGAIDYAADLIKMGARLNDMYSTNPGTVLAAAIEGGHLTLIRALQQAGAAVIGLRLKRIGNIETAVYLEDCGILQQILNVFGSQILRAAIVTRKNDLARKLLEYNIDLNAPIADELDPDAPRASWLTPLQAAIWGEQEALTYTLLERGATVTDTDLAEAVAKVDSQAGGDELVRRLLSGFHGRGPRSMAEAIELKRQDLVELFLASGVDPKGMPFEEEKYWDLDDESELSTESPLSILEILAKEGDRELLKVIIRACAWEPELIGRAVIIAIVMNHPDLLDDLLKFPVNLDQEITFHHLDTEDEDGTEVPGYKEVLTPLQAAAKSQQVSIVKKLLAHSRIDVNYLGKGVRRRTALQHAVENGNMELVNLLVSHNASVNTSPASDGGATSLQIAAIRGYIGIARRLVDLNAEVNAPAARYNGRTALEGAAEHGRIDVLQMLLEEKAAVTGDFGGRQYRRAIEFAEKNGHFAAARLLINFEPRQG
ncbi:ankyrin repeat-containing domain protein [Aspergillus carlsbadensis]|nr:ankyrin repeat-containing domain protein [Aspergillus carlsbadensis]